VPVYRFDLVNSNAVSDEAGMRAADDLEAMEIAELIAGQLRSTRPDLGNGQYSIVVTDEDGDEICRLPLSILH